MLDSESGLPNNKEIIIPESILLPGSISEYLDELVYMVGYVEAGRQGILSDKYQGLEVLLEKYYDEAYSSGESYSFKDQSGDLSPDYLFQQYALIRDLKEGNSSFNSFGLYMASYLDGLRLDLQVTDQYPGFRRYLELYEDPRDRDPNSSLLLGASSLTTVEEYVQFMRLIDPKASVNVVDIHPLAVAIANKEGATAVLGDVLDLGGSVEQESIDVVMTNFLLTSLIYESNYYEALNRLFKGINNVLKPGGRVIMVEAMKEGDIRTVADYAWKNEFALKSEPFRFSNEREGIFRTAFKVRDREEIQDVYESAASFLGYPYSDWTYGGNDIVKISDDEAWDDAYGGDQFNSSSLVKVPSVSPFGVGVSNLVLYKGGVESIA